MLSITGAGGGEGYCFEATYLLEVAGIMMFCSTSLFVTGFLYVQKSFIAIKTIKIVMFHSFVDITGVDVTEEMEVEEDNMVHADDPFSKTRLGNETNPFVGCSVPVSVHDDSDGEQEFNDRSVLFL